MVHLRNPVVGMVEHFVTGSVLRLNSCTAMHSALERSSTNHGVDMGRGLSRTDEGIRSLDRQWGTIDGEGISGDLGENWGQQSCRENCTREHDDVGTTGVV